MGKTAAENQPLTSGKLAYVSPGVARALIKMVNVYFIRKEETNSNKWVLVDAGMGNCSHKIKEHAREFMGSYMPPSAIILTHGHFDHVGGVKKLAEDWRVPVYAHVKELPYLTGKSSYPPPDPSVGGGAMSLLSFLYPNKPINISGSVKALPDNGFIPELPEWKIIETPGHSPGHISLFRESDGTLIAGDAVVTVKQESAVAVLSQKQGLYGPPSYFTCDWLAAHDSVVKLAGLNPEVLAAGHGAPLKGKEMRKKLQNLADNFETIGKPGTGRYVSAPARTNEQGVTYLPPHHTGTAIILSSIALAGIAGFLFYKLISKNNKKTG